MGDFGFEEVRNLKKIKREFIPIIDSQPLKTKTGNNSCECFPSHKL
jgi:hypothetical protein